MTDDSPSTTIENIDEVFDAAVFIVQNMPKEGPLSPSNNQKLKFYGLFKQATQGPCNQPKPAFWNPIERYKWDAWNRMGVLDSQLAKQMYVKKMQKMIDEVCATHDVTQWMGGNDWDRLEPILRPKFRLIGRELFSSDQTAQIISDNGAPVEACSPPPSKEEAAGVDAGQVEVSGESKPLAEMSVCVSDDEYTDAIESPLASGGRAKGMPTAESTFMTHFDAQIRLLSEQLGSLSSSLAHQSQLIANFMKEMNRVRRRGVGGLSWWMFALFMLWPFVAHYLLRLLIRKAALLL